jgi:peptide deformylase
MISTIGCFAMSRHQHDITGDEGAAAKVFERDKVGVSALEGCLSIDNQSSIPRNKTLFFHVLMLLSINQAYKIAVMV